MTYKGRGTHFRNLIGDTYNPDERIKDITVVELRQISNPYQKVNMGYGRRFESDKMGIVTGIKNKAIVYSC